MPHKDPDRNREYKRLQRRAVHAKWKAQGLCALCGKVPRPANASRCPPCGILQNMKQVASKADLKVQTFSAYGGGYCHWRFDNGTMCAEIDPDLLALDHVDNNGGEMRRAGKEHAGADLYRKLKKAGFPSGYQVLCHNHNWKKNVINLKQLREARYGHH